MTAPKKDGFVDFLEAQIRKELRKKETKPADRIKLIEAGAKLATTRQKIDDGGSGSGAFFHKPN